MSYSYPASAEERRAAALLRRKGWNVHEPECPDCHGWGTVSKTHESSSGTTKTISHWAVRCPRGCPPPVAIL